MPSLPKPRLRRQRGGDLAAPAEPRERTPQVETVQGSGLRWVNIERPTPLEAAWLEEQFDFHALDLEDVLSRNQRPKIDEYPDYLFIVLHFPVFDRAGRAPERGRARHLRRPRLPGHDPEHAAAAGRVPVRALPPEGGAARAALLARLGLPALPDHRRQLRLLLPDAAQDRQQARRARGRDLRGPLRGHRPRHLQREAGDHQLPQGDPPAADRAARPREARAALPRPRGRRARDLLRRRRRLPRADLGHARELQGGRRGARGDERVLHLAPRQRHPPRAHRDQRHRPAADPDREHLGHERRRPRRGRLEPTSTSSSARWSSLLVGMVAYFRRRGWL